MARVFSPQYPKQSTVAVAWEVDRSQPSKLTFHGYQARKIPSRVTPGDRLFYDRNKPFTKQIDFFDSYRPSATVTLPAGYLIPRGWNKVVELMKINGVRMRQLDHPTTLEAEIYRIGDVETRTSPYEGHYFHDRVELTKSRKQITAQAGDYLVPIDQPRARYVVETLEPTASDSLFRWNFFDTILQQKEHFSPYVFEETAEKLLASDESLRVRMAEKVAEDPQFAENRMAQLEFLYEHSPHYEAAYRNYPIARLIRVDQE